MPKTLRLLAPDWQAGDQPVYYLGAQLLSWLAPKNAHQTEVRLPIAAPHGELLTRENGVTAQATVRKNVELAQHAITTEQPDKIITFGGNCLVSQAPFSYLHEKYGEDLGVLWLDAHPDISTPAIFQNEHAMVLGNLLGHGDPALAELVAQPFNPNNLRYVGLQQPTADEVPLLHQLGLSYQLETDADIDIAAIQAWITAHHFKHLAIHFDLDVLDPQWFKGQYFAEPGRVDFPAAAGKLTPATVLQLLAQLSANNDIVGLTLAEYLPWDAVTLQKFMAKINIFD